MTDREKRCVLITGVDGMVGGHLARALLRRGYAATGTHIRLGVADRDLPEALALVELDIRYPQHIAQLVGRLRPDVIFHLAAQSRPNVSWERPQETLESNILGTANLFEAVRALRGRGNTYDPVVITACSSAGYGESMLTAGGSVTEEAPLLPLSPYGVSKVATDLLTWQYWKSDGIRGIRARIFNTSGPRKSDDVISDFAGRIAMMPPEGGPLRVGNLHSRRAFLHVADLIDALIRLSEDGMPGEAYNICGEEVVSMAELLPMFEEVSNRRLIPEVDGGLLRPTDEPLISGNTAKLRAATGWSPRHCVRDIVSDVYGDIAQRLAVRHVQAVPPARANPDTPL